MNDRAQGPSRRIIPPTGSTPPAARNALPSGMPVAPSAPTPPPPWRRGQAPAPQASVPAVDLDALRARIHTNEEATRAGVESLVLRFGSAQAAFSASREAQLAGVESTLQRRRAAAEAAYEAARSEIERQLAVESTEALSDSDRMLARLAPGAASAAWGSPAWTGSTAPADYLRVGEVHVGDRALAALAPLAPGDGWYITGDDTVGRRLLYQTVLRLTAQAPLPHLAIESYDPRTTATLAPLAPLRALHGPAFPAPAVEAGDFVRRLDSTAPRASLNAESVVSGGARSLTELWRLHPTPEGTLTIVTVLSYPHGVTQRLNETLCRLAELGPTAGVLVLVQEAPGAQPAERDVDLARLRTALRRIDVSSGAIRVPGFPDALPVTPDAEPSREAVAAIFDDIAARMSGDQGASVPLEELVRADLDAPWSGSALDGLDAVIGKTGRQAATVSFRTANPPHPNMLAGGMVGSGKSTFLLDVIYSLAVRYSPDELELVLLDFKQGVEFNVFAPDDADANWLPHARVLGLETDPEFGLAVLSHVVGELERRADLFKRAHVANYVDYRRGGASLTRMLVVIDEFHELFNGDEEQAREAVRLLETIARQGRSAGVHLLLASQTISGISSLGAKADAIFSQFPLRLSLKNNAAESQAILAPQNKAAADLRYRGEFILNREAGDVRANERGVAAFADSAVFRQAQSELWRMRPTRRPRIFYARRAAPWDLSALERVGPSESLELWIGQAIDVSGAPEAVTVTREVDQTVAIVGADVAREPVIPGLVAGMIITASHQLSPGDEIVVLTGESQAMPEWLTHPFAHAEAQGVRVRHVPASSAAAYLRDEIGTRTRGSLGRILLFALRIPQIPDLDVDPESISVAAPADPMSLTFSMERVNREISGSIGSKSAATVLRETAREGALRGVDLVASWPNVQTLNDLLGVAHRGIGTYITAGLGIDDLRTVSSSHSPRLEGHPRVGLVRRSGTGGLRSLVPFALWDAGAESEWEARP